MTKRVTEGNVAAGVQVRLINVDEEPVLVPDGTAQLRDLPSADLRGPRTVVVSGRNLFAELLGAALPVVGRIDPYDAVEHLPAAFSHQAQLLVIDGMLDGHDEAMTVLCRQAILRSMAVLVVGRCSDETEMATWVERGVGAFVDDSSTKDQLVETARQLSLGHTVLGVSIRESLLSTLRTTRAKDQERFAAFESLTKRERDVLRHLALGTSPEDVAKTSFVSLNTIRTQIRGILAKLDVGSVVAAVALAYRTGWLEADLAP